MFTTALLMSLAAGRFVELAAPPQVELVGVKRIDGDATDLSGLTDTLVQNCPHNRLGGFGSAITWVAGDRFLVLADRGPGDGAAWYQCRFHEVSIKIEPGAEKSIKFKLERAVMLTDERDRPFYGVASAIKPGGPTDGSRDQRLDPEGIAASPDGTIYISDEYGPHILAFNKDGKLQRRLPVPAMFIATVRNADEVMEGPPYCTSGRQANRGFEGLTLMPDGRLVALLQSPLLQDSPFDELNERAGRLARSLVIDPTGKAPPSQWVYPMSAPTMSLNEILFVDQNLYLAIERDGKEGVQARRKWITLVDTSPAGDVSAVSSLQATEMPKGLAAAKISKLIDLLDPRFGLAGQTMPAKIEGLAFVPLNPSWGWPAADRLLLVLTDNDFKANEDTRIWAFRIPGELMKKETGPTNGRPREGN